MPWMVSGERLWVKPAVMTVLSIAAAFVAKLADRTELAEFVPSVTAESVEKLLSVMAASMLVIATFAVLEHSRRALARAEHAMTLPDDIAAVRAAAASQA